MTEVTLPIPVQAGPRPACFSTEKEQLPYPALAPEIVDSFVLVYFVLEMLIKMLAKGGYGYEGSYLSNPWNKLDLFINSVEMFDYFLVYLGLHLPVCQVLAPMRLISRVTSMRDVVTVLLDISPMLVNVLILYLFVIHIFAVMGVQLWAGQLRNRCFLGENITKYNVSLDSFYMTKYDEQYPFICSPEGMNGMRRCHDVPPYKENGRKCSLNPPQRASGGAIVPTAAGADANACVNWNLLYNVCRSGDHNPHKGAINFDNIGYSWITIFQVVTLEGWSNVMFNVMDVYSFWSFLFFMLVTIMGSFIMMNVCAVVIATQFSDNLGRRQETRAAGEQRAPCLSRGSVGGQIWRPFRARLERVIKSTVFDRMIMFAVLLSILTMAIEHHKQPKKLTEMLRLTNNIFTGIFVVEMVLKLMGLRWTYFKSRNNLFDFFIVIISLWETISKADGRLSVLRAFRLLRFGRLLHFLPYLKKQLLVLKRAMEDAAPLCLIMLFVIFIYSLIGMLLFGNRFDFRTLDGHTDRKNFDTLLWSMVTVFQILTGEDWNLVLYNIMAATSPWAAIYFVALIMTGRHVLLNILVGIVIQGFHNRAHDSSQSPRSSPPISAPKEGSAPTNTNNRCLKRIRRALRWCKEHEEWSFYVFSPQNRFRIFCQRVISHKMFDYTVLLFILLNCVTIAMERPGIDPGSKEKLFLKMSSYVFTAVFLVEMLFKVLALGLLFGSESYCRSSWNVVDGLLVILSFFHILISLASSGNNKMLGIVKVLRLLRTFRPLRVIKRAPKLKLAVEALIASIKPIGNVLLICCAFFFFYAILGVQLFKGKFHTCVGEDIELIINKTDCLSANYRWERKHFNFDSLSQALLSLFVMYSMDGWVNIMYDGLDAVGVDKQPVMNHNQWMLLFFIPFMIMSFFLLDMFIGVMVETFHQCQQNQKRGDEEERIVSQGTVQGKERGGGSLLRPYYESYSRVRRSIHTLCVSSFLDLFMAVIIFMSVLVMAVEHYDQPLFIWKLTEYSHYVFTIILIIEVLLKLVAFGGLRFMQNSWNVLDVGVVLVSLMSIVLHEMRMADVFPINPSILRVCRVLRLAQVLKAKKIRVLLKTVIKTLSQVGNICLLFTFFFFIYAALGVELLGKLECVDEDLCLGINEYVNFKHFGMALLTLFQVCTGDNWSLIMKDALTQCRPGDKGCLDYLSWVTPIYFIAFVVMAQFVLANLVVAVIMQAMDDSNEVQEENNARR
ncbi:LOW QUALITY PROTEIN: voltage-dependent T-type calcium channel subunit alpha-1I-like [Anoplopoma fimbria]|uniref:LOW QUALITY PROTEIN: voltage-dependent T-type calcium channel subunit alpha-1I-like n=1 Tax=Anoplopoma fimbria TaxID=229290 RepID=UPI0023EB04B2|nr:LOW QUALITY PROTEIN: voltage-dependent T-type calcium channel subunit alpha-1I-like [Anoplopoma fimbria]